jgi:TPR repeat protein
MYAIAKLLWLGDGVEQDQAQAAALFARAAAGGHPAAKREAAQLLLTGKFMPRDTDRAFEYWHAVAPHFPTAALALCRHTIDGTFKQLSQDDAIAYCEQAARRNLEEAYLFLGEHFLGSPTTLGKGIGWLRQAAEKGSGQAALRLSKAMLERNFTVDAGDLRTLLTKAAAAGLEEAMLTLAIQFDKGTFGTDKGKEAYFWANLAAAAFPDNRHAGDARTLREKVARRLDRATCANAAIEGLRWLRENQAEKYRVIPKM